MRRTRLSVQDFSRDPAALDLEIFEILRKLSRLFKAFGLRAKFGDIVAGLRSRHAKRDAC